MDTVDTNQGANTETPAAKVAPETLAVRKAAMLAKINAGAQSAAAPNDDDDDADLAAPAAVVAKPKEPAEPAEGEHTARISDLSRQVRELTEQLTEAKGKIPAEDKYAALIARIKDDPAALLDEFAEHGATLEKISEGFLKRQDNPAHKELTAQQKEIAELKKWRDDREKSEKDAATAAETAKSETAGRAAVQAMVDGDKARWPVITAHADNAAEAIPDAIAAARIVAKKFGRPPTPVEAEKILGDCMDEVEKSLTTRGARYRKPDITPTAATSRRTIATPSGGTAGSQRAASGVDTRSLSEKKAAIIEKARRATPPKS